MANPERTPCDNVERLRRRRYVLRLIVENKIKWEEVCVHEGHPFHVALLPDGSRALHYRGTTVVRPFGWQGSEKKDLREHMTDLFFLAGKSCGVFNAPVIPINGRPTVLVSPSDDTRRRRRRVK